MSLLDPSWQTARADVVGGRGGGCTRGRGPALTFPESGQMHCTVRGLASARIRKEPRHSARHDDAAFRCVYKCPQRLLVKRGSANKRIILVQSADLCNCCRGQQCPVCSTSRNPDTCGYTEPGCRPGSGIRDLFAAGSERGGQAGAVSPGPGDSIWGPSFGDLSLQGCWTLMQALDRQQPAELLWELIWASGGTIARLLLFLLGARSLGLSLANWSARGNTWSMPGGPVCWVVWRHFLCGAPWAPGPGAACQARVRRGQLTPAYDFRGIGTLTFPSKILPCRPPVIARLP